MTTSQAIPSIEEATSSGQIVRPSEQMQRIRWKPFGPLSESIYVADNASDPSPQPPYQTGPTSFHPISAVSLTEPPISSITVTQSDLEDWEETWVEEHIPHADNDQAIWVDVAHGAEGDNDDADGDDGEGRRLMRCCDTSRPRVQPTITVKSSSQPYVTIHDYITEVHQWLQTIKESILESKGVHERQPLPSNTEFHNLFIPNPTLISLNEREPPQSLGFGADISSSSLSGDTIRVFQQIAAGQTPQPMQPPVDSEEYQRGFREAMAAVRWTWQERRQAWEETQATSGERLEMAMDSNVGSLLCGKFNR